MTDLLACTLPDPDPELAGRAARAFVRNHALEGLGHAREEPQHAAPRMAKWFRANRSVGSKDRPVVQALVYGVVRLEQLLRRAGASTDGELVDALIAVYGGERFEGLASEGAEADFATALGLDPALTGSWLAILGAKEAAALGTALSGRAPVTLRANRIHTTREALQERLAEEGVATEVVPGLEDALDLVGRAQLHELKSFRQGLFEVQDASSQRFAAAIPIEPGDRILDLCAGSGGKSLAIAARGYRVRAYDPRQDALKRLVVRAKRSRARVKVGDPIPAHVVVVDAPCSASGRLRRDPFLRWRLDPEALVPVQRQLIEEGGSLVLPGGALAYATCSLAPVENEHAPPSEGTWVLESSHTCWPHREPGDGFAWRIWRRKDG